MHVKINKIIDSLKLPKSDRAELNRLISRPEVQAIINADESEKIGLRKALLKEMADIPGKSVKRIAIIAKEAADAAKRFEMAEKEFDAARREHHTANLAATYGDYPDRLRVTQIERELMAGADPRIAEYRYEVGQLTGRLNMALKFWNGETPKTWAGAGKPKSFSNADDIDVARVELNKALVVLQELNFAAVTSYEITQALKDISSNLKGPLAEIEMHPPIINEFGEVKPPHRDGSMPIEETKAA
jgi:hypothetical protein